MSQSKSRSARLSMLVYTIGRLLFSLSRFWNRRFPGWRGGLAGFSFLAVIVLLTNIAALIWTASHLIDGYFATIAIQHCETTQNWSYLGQFIISLLSAGLLAGSNHCMQCLSSPTRSDIDTAHAKGHYLSIGTLSWKNIAFSHKRRTFMMFVVVSSGVPLHLVYKGSVRLRKPS